MAEREGLIRNALGLFSPLRGSLRLSELLPKYVEPSNAY
jgi:hypothetical protein